MKTFKTIPEQIAILESRGMVVDEEAATVLLREYHLAAHDRAALLAALAI